MATQEAKPEWTLYYYPMPGRAEFARLLWEEAGVAYEDVGRKEGVKSVIQFWKQQNSGFPVRAPPIVVHKGKTICQTPIMVRYIAKQLGMMPQKEDKLNAEILAETVFDVITESHDAFHAIEHTGSFESQKEKVQAFIEAFRKTRLPNYCSYFESCLKHNKEGEGFFFGEKLSYVDIVVFNFLNGLEYQFPIDYEDLPMPLLRAFQKRIAQRPNIAKYWASDRRFKFDGTGICM
jgi:glutathione S-transferase